MKYKIYERICKKRYCFKYVSDYLDNIQVSFLQDLKDLTSEEYYNLIKRISDSKLNYIRTYELEPIGYELLKEIERDIPLAIDLSVWVDERRYKINKIVEKDDYSEVYIEKNKIIEEIGKEEIDNLFLKAKIYKDLMSRFDNQLREIKAIKGFFIDKVKTKEIEEITMKTEDDYALEKKSFINKLKEFLTS